MSRIIISAYQENEIYVSSILPEILMSLSDKVFVSQYGKKSKARVIQDAKSGDERNYRIILSFQTGNIHFQLQSQPITGDKAKQLGFTIDESIEKYEEIGEMLRKLG